MSTKLVIRETEPTPNGSEEVLEIRLAAADNGDVDLQVRKAEGAWGLVAWITPDREIWLADAEMIRLRGDLVIGQ